MNIDAVKWGGMLLIILALMAGSAWIAWEWQANAYGQQLAAKKLPTKPSTPIWPMPTPRKFWQSRASASPWSIGWQPVTNSITEP